MTNEEKLKVFEKYLKMIKDESIRNFTEFVISKFPEYFWTIPASTSGNRHGKYESLVDHVLGCLKIAEKVIEQFDKHWTNNQNDQLLSALIFHDGWRCGEPGNESRFTQEYIDKKGYSNDLLNKLCTDNEHPEVGYKQLLFLSTEFNLQAIKIKEEDLQPILKGVRYHYGPWCKTKLREPFNLNWPFDSVIVQVHNIDFQQCINSAILTRGI